MKLLPKLISTAVLAIAASNALAANVLVVLSDADHLDLKDGKVLSTGFYLNELLQPVKLLMDAGHQVTFATPEGKAPTLDQSSADAMYFNGDAAVLKEYLGLLEKLQITSSTQSPVISLSRVEQIGYARFDAVYIPGGHAPMQDLLRSAALGRLLTNFHQNGKTTALVCHGPIALLSTLSNSSAFVQQMETRNRASSAKWIYAGYRMTVISNKEEEAAKPMLKGATMKFYPQTALEQAGANYTSNTTLWTPHSVEDRELITGQNPASALQVGQAIVTRLKQATR